VARKLIDAYFQQKNGPAEQQKAQPPQPDKQDKKELVRKPEGSLISSNVNGGQNAD